MRYAVFVFTAISLGSCGKLFPKKNSDEVQAPRISYFNEVKILRVEDEACQNQSTTSMTEAQIWEWDGHQSESKVVDFSGKASSDNTLASSGVAGAIAGYKLTKTCTVEDGELDCPSKKWELDESALKVLRFCRENGQYERDSLEAATLTSQVRISETMNKYRKLLGAKTLPDTLILPQALEVYDVTLKNGERKSLVTSDNAGMAVTSDGSSGIMMLNPTSVESFNKSPVNLWEVPFVIRHEYGHLVFNTHLGKKLKSLGLRLKDKPHGFGIFASPKVDRQSQLTMTLDDQVEKNLAGFNELFADLFAYYIGGGTANQVLGVSFLETTRDPASGSTAQGKAKVWDDNAEEIYTGMKSNPSEADDDVDFGDSHGFAAVLGHPIAALIDSTQKGGSPDKKLEVLLSWLDTMASDVRNGLTLSNDQIATYLVQTIMAKKTAAVEEVNSACEAFKKSVPALKSAQAACK